MSGVVSSTMDGATTLVTSTQLNGHLPSDEGTQWPTTNGAHSGLVAGMASPFTRFGSDVVHEVPDSTAQQIKEEQHIVEITR